MIKQIKFTTSENEQIIYSLTEELLFSLHFTCKQVDDWLEKNELEDIIRFLNKFGEI